MWTDADDDAPDPAPQFGRAGVAWFRAWSSNRQGVTALLPEIRARVLDLLCDQVGELVQWAPADDYRGPDFSNGRWTVKTEAWLAAFNASVATAQREATAALDAAHCTSLEAWLAAHAAGTLWSRGPTGGSARLPDPQRRSLSAAARRRGQRWPVRCRGCGESFTPTRGGLVNCPACRAAAKGAKGAKRPVQRAQPIATPTPPHEAKGANPAPPRPAAVLMGEAKALAEHAARIQASLEANMAEIQRRLRGES